MCLRQGLCLDPAEGAYSTPQIPKKLDRGKGKRKEGMKGREGEKREGKAGEIIKHPKYISSIGPWNWVKVEIENTS